MHMGMQDTALVPAQLIAVRGQQIVQRHPGPQQQIPGVGPLRGSQLEDRSPVGDGHDCPGAGQDALRQPGPGPDARVPGRGEYAARGLDKISAALIQL
jgi:hypothetical protein